MMKTTVRAALLGALALSVGACDAITAPGSVIRGSGVVVEQDRAAWGATIVQLHAPGELRIVQGATEEFWIQAEDNLVEHLRTRVDGRTLRIEVEHGIRLDPCRPIRYNLVVRDLERLVLTGSGRAERLGDGAGEGPAGRPGHRERVGAVLRKPAGLAERIGVRRGAPARFVGRDHAVSGRMAG
jgi:hypothetical protein